MSKQTTDRILAAIPGLLPEVLRASRQDWAKNPLTRQVLTLRANDLIESKRTSLESADAATFQSIQGEIKGVRAVLAFISGEGDL